MKPAVPVVEPNPTVEPSKPVGDTTLPVVKPTSIQDHTPPKIVLNGQKIMTVPLGSEFIDPGVKATDNVDGDLTARVLVSGKVNTETLGRYHLEYTVQDSSKNTSKVSRTVEVRTFDTELPTIWLNGPELIKLDIGDDYEEQGAGAKDNLDGDISGKIRTSGKVDTNTAGEYVLEYSVMDRSGNRSKIYRTVIVQRGVVFRDPELTLYENEYQHRIWLDLESDSLDMSALDFEVSTKSTATESQDFELSKNSISTPQKSGYFTLIIHDDDEPEAKETIVINVLNKGELIKELEITLDDTNSTEIVDHGTISGYAAPGNTMVVLDDVIYSFEFDKVARYDLVNHEVLVGEIRGYQTPQVAVYNGEIHLLIDDKLYLLDKNKLSIKVTSTAPVTFETHFLSFQADKVTSVVNDTLYVFNKPWLTNNYFSYDFSSRKWEKFTDLPKGSGSIRPKTTKVFGDEVYVLDDKKNYRVFNTADKSWSITTGETNTQFSKQVHFVGKYAYDFVKDNDKHMFVRYNITSNIETYGKRNERVMDYAVNESVMYKGRFYFFNQYKTKLLSMYWGDE
ncbi:DUF5011 domain-containing protein [Vibrio sagamiensis]|nr:DUF5011 domain-containing protein [Vibrio sagamiensis]